LAYFEVMSATENAALKMEILILRNHIKNLEIYSDYVDDLLTELSQEYTCLIKKIQYRLDGLETLELEAALNDLNDMGSVRNTILDSIKEGKILKKVRIKPSPPPKS